jgi:HD-GYP domain-containing protein (c-di-GMP phosphodiesterase class II)
VKNPSDFDRIHRFGLVAGVLFLTAYVVVNLASLSASGNGLGPSIHWLALFVLAGVTYFAMSGSRPELPEASPFSDPGFKTTVRTLSSVIDACDPFTQGRSYRISRFCVRVGEHLGISGQELEDLEYAALLHEIGRTAAHHGLILKSGRLSDTEMASLRTHPEISYQVLKDTPSLAGAAEIIRAHHEQPDGKGYPHELSGEDIPLGSRIIMVAAAFDAMTTDRPYRRGLSSEEAYEELRACSGTMFFPDVVQAFTELHRSRAIFDGFDAEELEMYRAGQYSSRAFEEFLAKAA